MYPAAVAAFVCVVILVGASAGVALRNNLPKHHLADDAKDVVRLGTGLIATIAALVLSLLISSANGTFETQSGEVNRLTADVILLDRLLAQYGAETRGTRDLLRRSVGSMVERIWQEHRPGSATAEPFAESAEADAVYMDILALPAQSEAQRALKARAAEVVGDMSRTRLLLFAQAGGSIPVPFLAVLVFWLAVIFASFCLFSRLNATLVVAVFIFALSASGAIFLILELSQPFTGLMQIPREPLQNALTSL